MATRGSSSGAKPSTTSCASTRSDPRARPPFRETGAMPPRTDNAVCIGLLGCGHVGGALVKLLSNNADLIKARTGVEIEVGRIAVHNLSKERDVDVAPNVFTNDAESVVNDPGIDVVVEMIGGIDPARSLILNALKAGKPVV